MGSFSCQNLIPLHYLKCYLQVSVYYVPQNNDFAMLDMGIGSLLGQGNIILLFFFFSFLQHNFNSAAFKARTKVRSKQRDKRVAIY